MDVMTMVDSLWKILVVGLLVGAGLPALFALGLRSLSGSVATAGLDGDPQQVQVGPGSKLAAGLCFLVVVAAVVVGILFTAGMIGK